VPFLSAAISPLPLVITAVIFCALCSPLGLWSGVVGSTGKDSIELEPY
jgi:hypothetical protein